MRSRKKYSNKINRFRNPFVEVTCYVPESLMSLLLERAADMGVSVETLATRAITNALKGDGSLSVDMDFDSVSASEVTERDQQILYRYICAARTGIPLDLLIISAESVGFIDEYSLKAALKLLVATNRVEVIYPNIGSVPDVIGRDALKPKTRSKSLSKFAGVRVDGKG